MKDRWRGWKEHGKGEELGGEQRKDGVEED